MSDLKAKSITITALSSIFLAGCGGGGGNGTFCGYDAFGDPIFCQSTASLPPLPAPVASTSTFALAQGLMNIANQNYAFNVSATDPYGNIFTIAYASTPGPVSTFSSAQANTAAVSQTLSENGQTIDVLNATDYFVQSPFQFLGSGENIPGGSEVVNSWQTPPVTATVGQIFPSLTSTLYHDSTNSLIDGTLNETIGLSPDTASTALLCQTDTVQLTQAGINDGLFGGTTSNCFRVDTNGNVLGMQINTQVNGIPMLFY